MLGICGRWMNRESIQWGEHVSWGAVLQFGVLNGSSLRRYMDAFDGCPVVGFDSFRGLPAEAPGLLRPEAWRAGAFSATASDAGVAAARAKARVVAAELGGEAAMAQPTSPTSYRAGRVTMVPGYYEHSLTAELARDLLANQGPASFIDIDSDLYVSAFAALDWVFAHQLVRVGTVIRYDDWWTLPCAARHHANARVARSIGVDTGDITSYDGEPRAHFEVAQKHNVTFSCACGPCNASSRFFSGGSAGYGLGFNPYFVVEAIGGRPDPGFNVSASSMHAFLRGQNTCKTYRSRRSFELDWADAGTAH